MFTVFNEKKIFWKFPEKKNIIHEVLFFLTGVLYPAQEVWSGDLLTRVSPQYYDI